MKKAIILLAVGFSFAYCNPSQQAGQTATDSTSTSTGTSGSGTSGSSSTDTSSTSHTDSLPH